MNSNEYEVLKLMLEEGKPLFFREISKKSGISIGGTQQVFKEYCDFIVKRKSGRNTYYSFKDNLETFYLKVIIETKKMQNFVIKNPLFREFLEYFMQNNIPCLIFGSYAKGSFKRDSDIDILVLSSRKIPEHLCPVEPHVISLSKKQFEMAVPKNETLIKELKRAHIFIASIDYFTKVLEDSHE